MKPAELNLLWRLNDSSLQFECMMKLLLEHCAIIIDNIMKLPETKMQTPLSWPLSSAFQTQKGANALARQESFTLNPPPLYLSGTTETFFQTLVLLDSDDWYFKSSIAFLHWLNMYINVPRKIFEGNYSCLLLLHSYKWMHAKQGVGERKCCLVVMLLGNSLISLTQYWCFYFGGSFLLIYRNLNGASALIFGTH